MRGERTTTAIMVAQKVEPTADCPLQAVAQRPPQRLLRVPRVATEITFVNIQTCWLFITHPVVDKVLKHGVIRTTSIMDKRRDAQLVLRLQRVQLLHVVGRVEFTTIYVSTMNVQNSRIGHDAGHQQEYKCPERRDQSGERVQWWPTVSFSFVGSAPAQGIQIMGYSSQYRNACGWAVPYMYSSGEYVKCEIYVHSDIGNMNCTHADLMEHEIGHCSGFARHTDDKTVMNKYVGVGPRTSAVTNMISLLYSLSPGKNISSKLTSNYSRSPKSSIAYEKNGRKLIPLGIYFTEENK